MGKHMKNFHSWILIFILLMIASCSSSTDSSNGNHEEVRSRTYLDAGGDVPYSFVDIDSLDIEIKDSNIVIRLSLMAIPDTLIYDRSEVPANMLEYQWNVIFDLDQDMSLSEGDLQCGLYRFKFDSTASEKSGPLLEFTQKDLAQYTADGIWHRIGSIQADITGSTINLHIGQAELDLLAIEAEALLNVPLKFETAYYKDQTYWEDVYPESGYVR